MKDYKKAIIIKIILAVVFAILFATLVYLKSNVEVCEYFATHFARGWIFVAGNMFGWIPFSMYELLLIAVIAYGIFLLVSIIVLLVKHNFAKLLNRIATALVLVLVFLNVYTATASFSYNRAELPLKRYSVTKSGAVEYEKIVQLADYFAEELNYAYEHTDHDEQGNVVYPYTFDELCDIVQDEYSCLTDDYFSPFTPNAKLIMNGTIMSELGIVGVFFAPTGEANINSKEVSAYLPFTIAHELAHSKGVMREYEADLTAYYVLLKSSNMYLRYSALFRCYQNVFSLVSLYPNSFADVSRLYNIVNSGVSVEKYNYYAFWDNYHLLDDIGEFFNDLYLKINGESEGTESYYVPPVIVDTGEEDDYGEVIVQISNYSSIQSLIVQMFLDGELVSYAK